MTCHQILMFMLGLFMIIVECGVYLINNGHYDTGQIILNSGAVPSFITMVGMILLEIRNCRRSKEIDRLSTAIKRQQSEDYFDYPVVNISPKPPNISQI